MSLSAPPRPTRVGSVLLLAACAWGASAPAQQLRTASGNPVPQVSATVFLCNDSRSLPAGVVGAQTTLRAIAPCTYFGETADATLTIDPAIRESAFVADTRTFSPSAIPAIATADGTLLVDVVGTTRGTLVVTYTLATNASSSGDALRVDVGADGSPELVVPGGAASSGHASFGLTVVGSLTTELRFAAHASGRDPLTGSAGRTTLHVRVQFVPRNTITFDTTATGCGPTGAEPALAGIDSTTVTGHRVDLALTRGIPNAFAAFVFATRTASTPIPLPPGCAFLVEPFAWTFVPTDAAGRASLALGLPRLLPPGELHLQAVTFDWSPRVWASNRLAATLWP